MSESGMPVEEISHLVGHSSTVVTETVYRQELRPVIRTGADAMDKLFPSPKTGQSEIVVRRQSRRTIADADKVARDSA